MPWVRFDDQFPIHRKVDGLSDAAYRLHTSAIFWCARNLTDGFVSDEDLDGVTARVRTPARFAAECVKRGAWHEAREPCDSASCPPPVDKDGWRIHDYLEYQPSKAQVIRDREAAARRQANWRARRADRPVDNPESRVSTAPAGNRRRSQDFRNGVSNGVSNGVTNATPYPPRPEGKRGVNAPERASGRASPPGPPAPASPRPPWCGQCDELTRQTGDPDSPGRCKNCHPLVIQESP